MAFAQRDNQNLCRDSCNLNAKALDLAVGAGRMKACVSTCRLLLAFRADPNYPVPTFLIRSGGSPLLTSIWQGSERIVRLLLEKKADPNMSVEIGSGEGPSGEEVSQCSPLPLELASRAGHLPVVKALLDYQADVNAVSGQEAAEVQGERTALLAACDRCHVEVFQALLAQGADPDQEVEDPNTETGMRSVRDTLAWMMGVGDARNFRAYGTSAGYPAAKLENMFDLLTEAKSHFLSS
eukprot:gnl/MRDRNA2_/MRDRNA2_206415_c0_seq1.p1 gnl/MRDRNA2_/MRDRNA2_206415_c0~~gnl/MRDRNA2_/MRDRNA2_206415_c0_seq1.p1  ORF type:complete len:255 (-),score=49.36 gnl/MRDRNA2_/MRDRNA2_206415_c0_seq1:70-783(-)